MIVEIRKVGFVNKGAELMLQSVLQQVSRRYPDARFAMAPHNISAPYDKRAALGLLQKASLWRHGVQWGTLAALAPRTVRTRFGVILDKEIDVVLDAAGFEYSDQWGPGTSVELADSCERWKRQATKVILLPQAFGPFSSRRIKTAIRAVLDSVDLMFARDQVSYEHLVEVAGPRPNVRIAPDFTNLIAGVLPDDFDVENNRFCLVPNGRMVDKTDASRSVAYVPFMAKCAAYLLEKGVRPFILVHGGANDLALAEDINAAVDGKLSIVQESNPVRIKGIIGACDGLIGSRFHALVSALSQGVPSLAAGWSHKYRMLLADYGFSEGLLNVSMNGREIHQRIDMIADPQARAECRQNLLDHSRELKSASQDMWREVFSVIDNDRGS